MIRLLVSTLLLLGVSAIAADRSGEYVGTFSSTDGDDSGQLRVVVQKSADNVWSCRVFFAHGGEEVVTKPGPCSIENDKFSTEFDFDTEGTSVHAKLTGTAVDDQSIEGTYTSAGPDGSGDHGKWKISLKR